MLLYLLHKNYIYTYRLPSKVEGSYVLNDYDDENKVRNLVNISSSQDKWIINSNNEVIVNYNGQLVNQIELKEFCFYTLQYLKQENIILYVLPGNDTNWSVFSVDDQSVLSFGNNSNNDGIFLSQNVAAKQIQLKNNKGVWEYKNLEPNIPVYVNKKRIDEANLYSFDVLFVMGFKVILLNNKIIITYPPRNFDFIDTKLISEKKELAVPNSNNEENVKDFYDQSDYFSKSPVFRKKIENYDVTITSPSDKVKNDSGSIFGQLVPSGLMSITSIVSAYYAIQNYRAGKIEKESFVTTALMCIVMLITGIVWPIVEWLASKFRNIIMERVRIINYKRYLKRKRKQLNNIVTEQKAILEFNNLSLNECFEIIQKRTAYLFSRNIRNDYFLSITFGVGKISSNIQFDYKRPELIVDNDKLLDQIDKLIDDFKYIENAPFSIDLKNNSLAVVNSSGLYEPLLKAIILQLITLHDYSDLKLVVLTSEFSILNKIRNLNHCWSDDRSIRFFAKTINEAESISSELMKIFNKNIQAVDKDSNATSNYYLIVSDCIEQYKGLTLVDKILSTNQSSNFSMLMFSDKMSDIPTGCNSFVVYNNQECSYFKSEMEEGNTFKFQPRLMDNTIDFNKCIDLLSNIPIKIDNESKGLLPDKLGFLEMYGVGNLEQLNIINHWKTSAVVSSLAAPIGVDYNGNLLTLDLHEKKHGPHGLIAGMTGSGKSEFIITYILSLSINYSPDEVQFVLIDYKGGGLAGAFENRKTGIKLPHLVGTITNLDKSEMNRTLVSIKSELQRRQRKFNEAKELLNTGSMDIYKYQSLVREGTLTEPMSHLFIICDEFAELKAQQPDFMDELVSAARIGRSLGIHLILATQKPSGVVDDQIWSNSKFKVCCKVQTTEDSTEMIRRPDAAFLKEAGRFYLLVGYDQYFVEGQSGYSGVQYIPSQKVISKLDNSISFINDIGDIYKNIVKKDTPIKDSQTKKYGEELTNILHYIVNVANQNNYSYHQLWLDNVPTILYYNDLIKKYKMNIQPFDINPIVGEYDDPEHQSQGIVTIPITRGGNTFILGASGMGKSTLLTTLIYSSIINHRPEEVNFYIMDFGSEKLKKFSKAPHVGDVLSINDKNKISYLFYMIDAEISKRRKYYSDNGGDFAQDVKNGKSVFQNIIVIIYGMEVFRETFEDVYDELFLTIIRNCSKFGINFIVSGASTSSLGYSAENSFPQKILLNLMDASDYQLYFTNPPLPSKNAGRGLVLIDEECMQFQTSLIFNEYDERKNLGYVIDKLNEICPIKAKSIPVVPKKLELKYLLNEIRTIDRVPLGINIMTAQIGYFNFNSKLCLMSASQSQILNKFMPKFIKILSLCANNNIIILNALDNVMIKTPQNIMYYNSNFKKVFPILTSNIKKMNDTPSTKNFTIIVLGYTNLNSHMTKLKEESKDINNVDDLIMMAKNNNFKFILFDVESLFRKITNGELSDLIDNQNGIWVGPDFDSQDIFEYERNSFMNQANPSNDTVVIVQDSISQYLKFPTI